MLWRPGEAKFNTPLGSDGQERVLAWGNNLAGYVVWYVFETETLRRLSQKEIQKNSFEPIL